MHQLEMTYIFVGNSHLDKFKLPHTIPVIQQSGASIRGLRNCMSTTGLNKQIISTIQSNPNATLVFHLGQVDIEFGYYYKSVLKNEKLDMEVFQNELINIFKEFLSPLLCKKIIIGVHVSAIKDLYHTFTVNFNDTQCHINNQIQETGTLNPQNDYSALGHIYNDTIETRNIYLKQFNDKLFEMCKELNILFIDIWNETSSQKYQPVHSDHHLVPNVELGEFIMKHLFT